MSASERFPLAGALRRWQPLARRLARGGRADTQDRLTPERQLERLELYGAHISAQNDRGREQLERLERYGAHISAQNDRASERIDALERELTSRVDGRLIGVVPGTLARELSGLIGIRRAVETGTYTGGGARRLAGIFAEVTTIELSRELYEAARGTLADVQSIRLVHGDSRDQLSAAVTASEPTLYWLDGHWSSGPTAGEHDQCAVLEELELLAAGHPDDCIIIDDARFFVASPPPPWREEQWPALVEVIDALRRIHPEHHVTVVKDLVIGVPARAKPVVDAFAWRPGFDALEDA